ncbi:MAG: endonuclease Q family protein [Kiritimatiellia bacterium]|nr:endonuclease Q family protein [Kiritimatiellia bacterium]
MPPATTPYYADLHIHSHYSRATSPACTPEGLFRWARLKGVGVCGTGDCTHPAWLTELRAKLTEDAPGLFALKPALREAAGSGVPESCRGPVRFMLTGEISSIYRRDGACRKVHSLVLLPSFEAAAALNERLARVGNILSDGRPILGLDPRDLLTMLLECDPRAALIPAHIWTPWFSLLGAKSGFDSPEACFGDLAPHVFAAETGLSSDVPMNRRIRCLDRLTLVSNSDLHSPANLGRNATVFYGEPAYDAILHALRTGDPAAYGGTVDLFPEEGKYFLDGHRACRVRLTPEESLACGSLCPACGKPVTIGVLHRVAELERRQDAADPSRARRTPFRHMVPLPELLSQQLGTAPGSKKVAAAYQALLERAGPELPLLLDAGARTLGALGAIGEAIRSVREGRVIREGGYDGEYGSVRVA